MELLCWLLLFASLCQRLADEPRIPAVQSSRDHVDCLQLREWVDL